MESITREMVESVKDFKWEEEVNRFALQEKQHSLYTVFTNLEGARLKARRPVRRLLPVKHAGIQLGMKGGCRFKMQNRQEFSLLALWDIGGKGDKEHLTSLVLEERLAWRVSSREQRPV